MNINKLTFRDIMSTEILYYDKDMKAKCLDICRRLDITYIPDIDRRNYHLREGNDFIFLGEIPKERKFQVDHYIFEPSVLDVFKYSDHEIKSGGHTSDHDVAFVFDKESLAGIVHICDYNKPAVMVELFKDVATFEEKLRELLFLNNGEDMDQVMEEIKIHKLRTFKKIKEDKPEHERMLRALGPFQGVYLRSLMDYSVKTRLGLFDDELIEPICQLRNQVMHSSDRVSGETQEEIRSYDLESLQVFLSRIEIFESVFLKLHNRINLANWSS